eukprot:6832-Heterococcus_DN1.PRE.1
MICTPSSSPSLSQARTTTDGEIQRAATTLTHYSHIGSVPPSRCSFVGLAWTCSSATPQTGGLCPLSLELDKPHQEVEVAY